MKVVRSSVWRSLRMEVVQIVSTKACESKGEHLHKIWSNMILSCWLYTSMPEFEILFRLSVCNYTTDL